MVPMPMVRGWFAYDDPGDPCVATTGIASGARGRGAGEIEIGKSGRR